MCLQAVHSVPGCGADQSVQEAALSSGPGPLLPQTGPQPQGPVTVLHSPAAHSQSPGGPTYCISSIAMPCVFVCEVLDFSKRVPGSPPVVQPSFISPPE